MLEQRKFFKNYQLLRNLAYIDDPTGSRLLLIFPQANSHAKREAARFLNESLLPHVKERVSVLYAEDLMSGLLRELPSGETADTLRLVIQKYALDGGTPPPHN